MFSAGDHVKFGFPAAAAMTVLAWGGISYEAGYRSAGEFEYLLDAVKWGTDYFIKCHVSDNEFYGQVEFETLKNDHYNFEYHEVYIYECIAFYHF